MKLNTAKSYAKTNAAGGGAEAHTSRIQQLERLVASCLLWESTFYTKGNDTADQIKQLTSEVSMAECIRIAVKAKSEWKLRHVPLWLLVCASSKKDPNIRISAAIADCIQRPDELSEFLAMYWKDGKKPIAAQVKKGLAKAFQKFDEYQLAKWNKDGAIKLRDVLFMVHAKPKDQAQADLWKRLVANELATPDTWEVALSGGADKKTTFTEMLNKGNLPYMATLRNVRNMIDSGVDSTLVSYSLLSRAANSKALPFRYVAAARACPSLASVLSDSMLKSTESMEKLSGSTVVIVDVSGSMDSPLSSKADLTKMDAASALAVLTRELSENCRIFSFSNQVKEIPNYRGLGLIDLINKSQPNGGTDLAGALKLIQWNTLPNTPTRVIVITDEQSQSGIIPGFGKFNYILNVATDQHGLSCQGGWERINGFSESFVEWMKVNESSET